MKSIANKTYSNIPIINADLFDLIEERIKSGNNGSSVIVPHVCNNIDLFGAGFAHAIAEYYPIVKENYHLLGKTFLKNNAGYVQYVKTIEDKNYGHSLVFANMIAQNEIISKNNPRPLNYYSLCKAMHDISIFIKDKFKTDQKVEIHAPKFGCGLAGGNWNFVQELIRDIWKEHKIFIYQK
jgi:hypothetical protein